MTEYLPWLVLALLGGFHGVNPGMGWLFAVALGLQERRRAAVLRAFGPIALGHAASVAVVVAVVAVTESWLPPVVPRTVGATALIVFGLSKLLAPMSHPRWVGMRVNARDLVSWSFLMSTAHGAGLMLVPLLLRGDASPAAQAAPADPSGFPTDHAAHLGHAVATGSPSGFPVADLAAVGLHTAAMFLVMGVVALVVFERLGLAILRRAWFNLDRVWAIALIGAGALTYLR